ncbi:CUL1 [Cordylochernes scorpioides]|uniref:CUL1 n=1 Tax=Cordylochernes scorpioides TaxID=51811 RepID=A0ABY6KZY0_9ARAC|nr:CUL1 [Cordylochernes scorpioides]
MDMYLVLDENNEIFEPFIQAYKEEFEAGYIECTKEFYTAEGAQFFKSHSVMEYLALVERRMAEECSRVDRYFHPSTYQPLRAACQDVLILKHMDLLKAEFARLVSEGKHEDMSQILRILDPVQYSEICLILENTVEAEGRDILEKNKDMVLNDIELYFSLIVKVRDKFNSLLEKALNNETQAFKAIERAHKKIINSNCVTLTHKTADINAEFLAQYSDSLLNQKGMSEEDFEEAIDKVGTILSYIESKDIFLAHYLNLTTERLILNNTRGHDLEEKLLTKIKERSDDEMTFKLERMLADYKVSKKHKENFEQFLQQKDPTFKVKMEVTLLTDGIWPHQEERKCSMPFEIEWGVSLFQEFYFSTHSGSRKLTWMYSVSKAEIETNFYRKPYIFQSSTFQMIVLFQFNDAISFSIQQLQERTQIQKNLLLQVLTTLLKTKVLSCEGELNQSAVVGINSEFRHKKTRVDINIALASSGEQDEPKTTKKEVVLNREVVMEAAMVRVMKSRKQLSHEDLLEEVTLSLRSRFKVDIELFKKCVEHLIEMDYLERGDHNGIYKYVV